MTVDSTNSVVTLREGSTFAGYALGRKLGEGAMGENAV